MDADKIRLQLNYNILKEQHNDAHEHMLHCLYRNDDTAAKYWRNISKAIEMDMTKLQIAIAGLYK